MDVGFASCKPLSTKGGKVGTQNTEEEWSGRTAQAKGDIEIQASYQTHITPKLLLLFTMKQTSHPEKNISKNMPLLVASFFNGLFLPILTLFREGSLEGD